MINKFSSMHTSDCFIDSADWFTHLSPLPQDLSATLISAWRKEQLRTKLKGLKKSVDDMDRTRKAQLVQNVSMCVCLCMHMYIVCVCGVCMSVCLHICVCVCCVRELCACIGAVMAMCTMESV